MVEGSLIRQINKEEGQSTIEFLVSLTLVFGFLFSFFKIAIVYTNGYLVHFAVFQASRAYMVGERGSNSEEGSDGEAKAFANEVFESYQLDGIINGFDATLNFEEPPSHSTNATNLFVGVRADYLANILIPGTAAKIDIELTSESYLGLEPTRAECFKRICDAMAAIGSGAQCGEHSTVSDNGC